MTWSDSDLELASDMEQGTPRRAFIPLQTYSGNNNARRSCSSRNSQSPAEPWHSPRTPAALASRSESRSGSESAGSSRASSRSTPTMKSGYGSSGSTSGRESKRPKGGSSQRREARSSDDDDVRKGSRRKQPWTTCTYALLSVGVVVGLIATVAVVVVALGGTQLPSHGTGPTPHSMLHPGRPGVAGAPVMAGGTPADSVRVIHISLANSDRKVRYGVADHLSWDAFLKGVQERLQLAHTPTRIETSEGMLIRSEVDLQHRDNLVVFEAEPEQSAAIEAWSVEDVVKFFQELKLPIEYTLALEKHEVTGAMMLEVVKDDAALAELGITSKLHASKLRARLKSMRR